MVQQVHDMASAGSAMGSAINVSGIPAAPSVAAPVIPGGDDPYVQVVLQSLASAQQATGGTTRAASNETVAAAFSVPLPSSFSSLVQAFIFVITKCNL